MKVGIMQPYFFPYLGYFSLIKHTDFFILFDQVKYIRHGWIERNRILKPEASWQYVKVPLRKHSSKTLISDIQINNDNNWRDKIYRQLVHYKKRAPFYTETISLLEDSLNIKTNSIVKLNENVIKHVCRYINVDVKIEILSEMDLEIEKVNAPDEWALNICKALNGVSEYWNPEGGLEFFNRKKYEADGIDIKFLKMNLSEYPQKRVGFETGLSIIDVMMFNEPEKINKMLDNFEFL
jgi:hypothetical protein